MLRPLLGVRQQLLLQGLVGGRVGPSRARAGQGPVGDLAVGADAAEDLGRAGDEDRPAALQVDHVGARVHHPQGPVDLERVRVGPPLEALREHELEDVPGQNVLLGLGDGAEELGPRHVARGVRPGRPPRRLHRDPRRREARASSAASGGEPRRQRVEPGSGVGVRALERAAVLVEVRPGNTVSQLRRAVEGDDVVVAGEVHVRELLVVRGSAGEGELGAVDVADGVVPENWKRDEKEEGKS